MLPLREMGNVRSQSPNKVLVGRGMMGKVYASFESYLDWRVVVKSRREKLEKGAPFWWKKRGRRGGGQFWRDIDLRAPVQFKVWGVRHGRWIFGISNQGRKNLPF